METSGVASPKGLKGCSPQEIKAIEDKYQLKLPDVYKEYLRLMGHRSGRLFTHDHLAVFYKYVLKLTEEFTDDVINQPDDDDYYDAPHDFELPDNSLIISSRLAAWWLFIVCDGDADPPVWSVDENDWKIEQFHASVSGWLEDNCLQAEAAIQSGYYTSHPQGTTP